MVPSTTPEAPDGRPDEAPGAARQPAAPPESVARSASLVSVATLCSRVLGLVREGVFAALFAAGHVADAFTFAFRIPNLLRDFFAEGALASAFVPTLAEARAKGGDARAFALVRRVVGTLGAVASIVVLLGILFAPALVAVIAPEAPESFLPLTITLTRIMFPFLLLVALASVAMGVLNTWGHYFRPALAPAFFNVVAVLGGVTLLILGYDIYVSVTAWACLVVFGGLAQLLIQLPGLRRIGCSLKPEVDLRLRDPGLRQIVRRMGPVVIGLAGTNLMLVITTALASREQGWASGLNYAFRLVHLPIGVIGVAVGTVVLSAGARRSAAKDEAGFAEVVRRGLRLNAFLALPAAVGLFLLAEPLTSLLYRWGRFGGAEVVLVSQALPYYAAGVLFYAGVKAAAPAFLARGDTRTPMLCSLAGIAVNIAVALALIDSLGHRALALAVTCGAMTNFLLLRGVDRARHGGAGAPALSFLARIVLAAGAMGGVGALVLSLGVLEGMAAQGRALEIASTLGLVAGLAFVYFAAAGALGVEEARGILARVRGRFRS